MQHRYPTRRGRVPRARGRPPISGVAARDPAHEGRAPRSSAWTHPAVTPRPSDREDAPPAALWLYPQARGDTDPSGRDPPRRAQRGVHIVGRGSGPGRSAVGRRLSTGPPRGLGARDDPGAGAPRCRPERGGQICATGPPGRGPTAAVRPGRNRPGQPAGPADRGSGPGGPCRRRDPPRSARITRQIDVPPGAPAPGTIRSGTARDGPPRRRGEQMKQRRVRGEAPARAQHPRSDRGEARVTGRPRHPTAASARRHNAAVRADRLREAEIGLQTFME